jgi:putative oxygen-independent coproporphyrinogen III oxidase
VTHAAVVEAGIYVHVPFCLTRCGYCDFNAYAGMDAVKPRYVAGLEAEAELIAADWRDARFVSVFLGGGTPTTLEPASLSGLLGAVRERFDVAADAEITIEANPDTVDRERLEVALRAGYDRVSIGAQSFDAAVLASLERIHSAAAVRRAVAEARAAGAGNLNLDLIYGAYGEGIDSWCRSLEEAIDLGPEHISAYALTVEPATPLGRRVAAGEVPPPDPDEQADMFSLACDVLADAGYGHYEVSNWARPGFECRHNLGYWQRRPYVGLGAGAHSHRDRRRWWNLRPPEAYLASVESGRRPIAGDEELSSEDDHLEDVLLRMRTFEGVPAAELDGPHVRPLLDGGLLARRERNLVPTERGMLLLNELVLALTR